MMRKTLANRFWEKVAFLGAGPDDCWVWRGVRNAEGYGKIGEGGVHGRTLQAHRVSYELANGPIAKGMFVCHHCDNPSCVNPAHLFLGTQADNTQDMMNKGRSARGDGIGISKLISQQVYEIRAMLDRGISQLLIAGKYGVSQTAITRINTGKTWGWLL